MGNTRSIMRTWLDQCNAFVDAPNDDGAGFILRQLRWRIRLLGEIQHKTRDTDIDELAQAYLRAGFCGTCTI